MADRALVPLGVAANRRGGLDRGTTGDLPPIARGGSVTSDVGPRRPRALRRSPGSSPGTGPRGSARGAAHDWIGSVPPAGGAGAQPWPGATRALARRDRAYRDHPSLGRGSPSARGWSTGSRAVVYERPRQPRRHEVPSAMTLARRHGRPVGVPRGATRLRRRADPLRSRCSRETRPRTRARTAGPPGPPRDAAHAAKKDRPSRQSASRPRRNPCGKQSYVAGAGGEQAPVDDACRARCASFRDQATPSPPRQLVRNRPRQSCGIEAEPAATQLLKILREEESRDGEHEPRHASPPGPGSREQSTDALR